MENKVHARGSENSALCCEKGAHVKLADNLNEINCKLCLASIHETDIIRMEENNKTEQAETAEKQKETTIETDYAELVEEIRIEKIKLTELLVRLDAMLDRQFKVMKLGRNGEPDPEAAALVHGVRYPDELAICGAWGTKEKPITVMAGERVASDFIEINCPLCREIIKSPGQSRRCCGCGRPLAKGEGVSTNLCIHCRKAKES